MNQTQARDLLVVLYGGQSPEHEVSCRSAYTIATNADPARFEVELLAIDQQGTWLRPQLSDARNNQLEARGEPVSVWDEFMRIRAADGVIFPALHGPFGEDGTVQGMFELAGVSYVGCGVTASAVCMDKVVTKQVLAAKGLAVTPYLVVDGVDAAPDGVDTSAAASKLAQAADQFGFPIFAKPSTMGSSIGISLAHSLSELREAVAAAFQYSHSVLLEPAITGREIECSLLGSRAGELRAALPGEIVASEAFYSYEDKYEKDEAQLLVPADLTPAERDRFMELTVKAGRAVGVEGLARVDFLWDGSDRPLINEINTIPGFTSISLYPKTWEATGVSFAELIGRLWDLGKSARARK